MQSQTTLKHLVCIFFFLLTFDNYCIYSFKSTHYAIWRKVEGPWWVYLLFFASVFIDTDACLLHIQLLIYTLRNMEKSGRLRWQEMAQMTPDTSFGPLVSVFFFPFVFIDTDACLLHIQLLIYTLCDMEKGGRLWWREMAQKMPDTSFGPLVSVSFFSTRFYWY